MFGLLAALVLLTGSAPAAEGPFRDISFTDAQAAAVKEKKVVMIDFFTTWCGPCKKLDATTWKDAEVVKWLDANCIALKIDAEKQVELAKRFRVQAYPTIVLVKADGTVIDSIVGYCDAKKFLSDADDALAGSTALARAKSALTGHEKDFTAHSLYADELTRAGRYEEALTEYLWCFDESRGSSTYAGVRLSFLLGRISSLGQKFPAALRALEERRDSAEARLIADLKDRTAAAEVAALNRELKTPERVLSLYDRLLAAGPVPSNVRIGLTSAILGPLVELRRYQDALDLFDKPEGFVTGKIRMYEMSKSLRAGLDEASALEMEAMLKSIIVEECRNIYEPLVGVGSKEAANRVADLLIESAPTVKTYIVLIDAATRAGSKDTAKSIGVRGLDALTSATDRKQIEEALLRSSSAK